MKAIVAGAGIGGLTVAALLARAGWRVTVLERAAALGEVGAGLQMSPNAMRVLAALGVDGAVAAAGFEPEAAEIRRHDTGAPWLRVALGPRCRTRHGQPYIHVHRADLLDILADAARRAGVEIETGVAVAGLSPGGGVVTGTGERGADLVVGADGIRSAVREAMLGAQAPVFTGQVAWRGTVPAERLPRGLIPPTAAVWAGPGKHVVTYYLRGGRLVNFVAVEERAAWAEEGWSVPGDPAALRAAFAGWAEPVTRLLGAVEDTFLWGLFARPALPRWTGSRVALLGDACHPMLPFLAQGAAQAMEDGAALARHLSRGELEPALTAYEAERRPRASSVQAASRENAALYHLKGMARAKLAVAGLLPGLVERRLDGIYGHDAVHGRGAA